MAHSHVALALALCLLGALPANAKAIVRVVPGDLRSWQHEEAADAAAPAAAAPEPAAALAPVQRPAWLVLPSDKPSALDFTEAARAWWNWRLVTGPGSYDPASCNEGQQSKIFVPEAKSPSTGRLCELASTPEFIFFAAITRVLMSDAGHPARYKTARQECVWSSFASPNAEATLTVMDGDSGRTLFFAPLEKFAFKGRPWTIGLPQGYKGTYGAGSSDEAGIPFMPGHPNVELCKGRATPYGPSGFCDFAGVTGGGTSALSSTNPPDAYGISDNKALFRYSRRTPPYAQLAESVKLVPYGRPYKASAVSAGWGFAIDVAKLKASAGFSGALNVTYVIDGFTGAAYEVQPPTQANLNVYCTVCPGACTNWCTFDAETETDVDPCFRGNGGETKFVPSAPPPEFFPYSRAWKLVLPGDLPGEGR